jgi:predicted aspartyl protease
MWWRVPRSWATFSANSLPVITLRISDVIVRALVDTGASQSLIDPRLARQLNFQEDDGGWIVGVGTKPLQVSFVLIENVAIGRNVLKSFRAGIFDLTNLRIGIQLILGINAFQGYRLQFDFAKGRLYLLS